MSEHYNETRGYLRGFVYFDSHLGEHSCDWRCNLATGIAALHRLVTFSTTLLVGKFDRYRQLHIVFLGVIV